jgi:hypothetical protein
MNISPLSSVLTPIGQRCTVSVRTVADRAIYHPMDMKWNIEAQNRNLPEWFIHPPRARSITSLVDISRQTGVFLARLTFAACIAVEAQPLILSVSPQTCSNPG